MAFVPSSTITLCHVEFDNSYKNQVYFATVTEQKNYFLNRAKKTFADYLVVRKTLPSGALQSSVKVNANIDSLYGCNYMYYCNENHGSRVFYCFVDDLIYINEGTTEIVFETDVYQTWRFDVELLDSFVVREHSETDHIGDNSIPEPSLLVKDFEYKEIDQYVYPNADGTGTTHNEILGFSDSWGYLVVATNPRKDASEGSGVDFLMSGIYQGLYFYMFYNYGAIDTFIKEMEEEYGDETIMSITLIPSFSVSEASIGAGGLLSPSTEPAENQFSIDVGAYTSYGENFKPKNNKLYTRQFYRLVGTSHDGVEIEYGIELFDDPYHPNFKVKADISPTPSATLYPLDYMGISENIDKAVNLSNFPQSAWKSDAYKLWQTKNQYTNAVGIGTDIIKMVGGLALAIGSGGTLAGVGGGIALSGAMGLADKNASIMAAKTLPDNGHTGCQKSNLLTAMKRNRFDFYVKRAKTEFAKIIDEYFTMFGYQTNALKVPNVSSRPYFNYVETVDVNIADKTFGIPNKDMETLKKMYNNGVTLWKHTATIGDYSVDNSPT